MEGTRLARNPNDKWVAGVCGGIARWLGWDSTIVRIIFLLGTIFSVGIGGVIAYILLALVMPSEA
jgi:phage shock protein C